MHSLRYTLSLGLAAFIFQATALQAQTATQLNIPEVKVDSQVQKDAEKKMKAAKKEAAGITNAVKKDVERTIQQTNKQAEGLQKQQLKKTEKMRKEAGKGSEQGQAMRKEHSKKWWKFWGEKEPSTTK